MSGNFAVLKRRDSSNATSHVNAAADRHHQVHHRGIDPSSSSTLVRALLMCSLNASESAKQVYVSVAGAVGRVSATFECAISVPRKFARLKYLFLRPTYAICACSAEQHLPLHGN
jgi:hypothetical protein